MSREELRKNVAAVHCSGVLSLLERKMFNILLLQAYDDLLSKQVHQIPVRLLCALVGYNSNDWNPLKQALRAMCTTAVEFNLLGDGKLEKKWTISGMLADATLEGGMCTYSYSLSLARELFSPEVYTRINVAVQRQFRSAFSLNLHENCLRFRAVGSTGWWSIETFRNLVGASAPLYDDFGQLRRRVIKPAIVEVNEISEIQLAAEYDRAATRGNPVKAIRFRIGDSKQRTLFPVPDENDEVREKVAYKLLRELGLSERAALSAVLQDEGSALAIAQHVKQRTLDDKVRNPAAYTATLIQRGAVVSPAPIEKEVQRQRSKVHSKVQTAQAAGDRQSMKVRFEHERRMRMREALTAEIKADLLPKWVAHERGRGSEAALRGYSPDTGVLGPPASGMFEIFAVNQLLGEYTESDFEAWLDGHNKTTS